MKYVVIVNGKYIVNGIEAQSLCGAEHVILDNYDGIVGAQAFGPAEMKTAYFTDMCQVCQMISVNELKAQSEQYVTYWKEAAAAKREYDKYFEAVKELEASLASARKNLEKAEQAWDDAMNVAKVHNEFMGIPEVH